MQLIFSDLPLDPNVAPSDLAVDLQAVRAGFRLMVHTSPGTCLMSQLDYGCNLERFTFDVPDRTLAILIANEIERSTKRWCPEIDLPRSSINVVPRPNGDGYDVMCALGIPALGIVSNTNFSILI